MIFISVRTLIINAELTNPPSTISSFRDLTLFCKLKHGYRLDIILECEQDEKDIYFSWLRPKGALDFVKYIITPQEQEPGFRVDTKVRISPTIVVNRIIPENMQILLSRISV